MRKFILITTLSILTILLISLVYLSIYGVKTNNFNSLIHLVKNNYGEIICYRDTKKNKSSILLSEKLQFVNYLSPYLKYANLQSCLLVESKQFVN